MGRHKSTSSKNDEGESGTICNANNGMSREVECRGTIDVISIEKTD
jgi:hypothetical protein